MCAKLVRMCNTMRAYALCMHRRVGIRVVRAVKSTLQSTINEFSGGMCVKLCVKCD